MSLREDDVRLGHMLAHAVEAVEMAKGLQRADLDSDRKLNLALVRLVEIVGEAAARVSESTRGSHPEIDWRAVSGMRNRLIHGYDKVDFDILWDTLQIDLPDLIVKLRRMV